VFQLPFSLSFLISCLLSPTRTRRSNGTERKVVSRSKSYYFGRGRDGANEGREKQGERGRLREGPEGFALKIISETSLFDNREERTKD
jgi:hypothetical protein